MSNTQQTYIPTGSIHPLSTQVVDTDKAQTTAAVLHGRNPGSSTTFSDVKVTTGGSLKTESELVNTSGDVVNPATNEGLQDIVTAIEGITIPAPVGGATEAKQNVNNDLVDALYELVARLDFLPSIRGTSADIRTTITGGSVNIGTLPTLANVTTVGTMSNQTSVGGVLANPQIPSLMNTNAYLNNISNITIS